MKEQKIYKIRVTGEVLETPAATRRVDVNGQVLTPKMSGLTGWRLP